MRFFFLGLETQRARARLFFFIGEVERLAMLAAVDLRVGAELLLNFLAEEIPALEMAGAELFFRVLLIACPHPRDTTLYLGAIAERIDQFGHRDRLIGSRVFRIRHIENGQYNRNCVGQASRPVHLV